MSQQIARMPHYIKRIFRKHCKSIPGAIIAGGAVRDTLNFAPIKDIDIFVSCAYARLMEAELDNNWKRLGRGPSKLFDEARGVQPAFGSASFGGIQYGSIVGSVTTSTKSNGLNLSSISATNTSTYNSRHIVEVYEAEDESGWPLNLIFTDCDPVDYVVKHFDFGICKAWYDGQYVHQHGDFITDVNNKTITMTLTNERVIELYGSLDRGISSMRNHADRIQWKYPTFRIVFPQV